MNKGSLIPFLFRRKKRTNAFNAEIGTSFSLKRGEKRVYFRSPILLFEGIIRGLSSFLLLFLEIVIFGVKGVLLGFGYYYYS